MHDTMLDLYSAIERYVRAADAAADNPTRTSLDQAEAAEQRLRQKLSQARRALGQPQLAFDQ